MIIEQGELNDGWTIYAFIDGLYECFLIGIGDRTIDFDIVRLNCMWNDEDKWISEMAFLHIWSYVLLEDGYLGVVGVNGEVWVDDGECGKAIDESTYKMIYIYSMSLEIIDIDRSNNNI